MPEAGHSPSSRAAAAGTAEVPPHHSQPQPSIPHILADFPRLVTQHASDAHHHHSHQRFLVKRLIGRGSFACVYLMVDRAFENRIVVGKHMVTSHMTDKNRAFAFTEAQNASKFNGHPNVVHFFGGFLSTDWQDDDPTHQQHQQEEQNNHQNHSAAPSTFSPEKEAASMALAVNRCANLLLVFEFADAGDLSVQVRARSPNKYFRDHEVMMILAQIAMALHCLHKQHVMHRDLKTANIFLTSSGLMKLGDFGLSKEYDGTLSVDIGNTFCGTPYYVAPELWNRQRYSNKADVWSLGVVMYELMALRKPFAGEDIKLLVESICSRRIEPLAPECEAMYSPATLQLLYAMLSSNPAQRPSVGEILRTPVMQELGLKQLLVNVPRLSAIPSHVRDQLLQDVRHYMDAAAASPLTPPPAHSSPLSAASPSHH